VRVHENPAVLPGSQHSEKNGAEKKDAAPEPQRDPQRGI
jgi:hypothetical protein